MVYWSTISQESAIQYLYQAASSIRGVGRLPKGSLVLVRENDDNNDNHKKTQIDEEESCVPTWKYARIAGKAEGSLILLYLNPEESLIVSVEADKVIPVAPEMCTKFFLEEDPRKVREKMNYMIYIYNS